MNPVFLGRYVHLPLQVFCAGLRVKEFFSSNRHTQAPFYVLYLRFEPRKLSLFFTWGSSEPLGSDDHNEWLKGVKPPTTGWDTRKSWISELPFQAREACTKAPCRVVFSTLINMTWLSCRCGFSLVNPCLKWLIWVFMIFTRRFTRVFFVWNMDIFLHQ